MAYTDEYISSKLDEIGKIGLKAAPIVGDWQNPPYEDIVLEQQPCALIIKDVCCIVVVNRMNGIVNLVDSDTKISLVNSTLEKFCECAVLWSKISDMPDDIIDKKREKMAAKLASDLKAIDKAAFEDANQAWPCGVEELSYGI